MEDIYTAINDLMQPFKPVIGKDYEKYHNHVCRVVNNCLLFDSDKNNVRKYVISGVFHDIGIWTHNTIDYLAPSVMMVKQYLINSDQQQWIPEIEQMINWHHKTTAYKGIFQNTVNNFRKADWIDVSLGLLSFGSDRKASRLDRRRFPNRGFHLFLVRKIFRNLLKHPLNPLPMFRL